jgi:hypothetical protein
VTSRPGVRETRQARRIIRIALTKCHDFERGRKVARLCPKCGRKGLYFSGVLSGIDAALLEIRDQLTDDRAVFLVDEVRQRSRKLNEAIAQACQGGHLLKARFVSTTLWAHRALFRYLLEERIGVRITPDTWSGVSMPAIALWGNAVAAVAYVPIRVSRLRRPRPWSHRWRQRHLNFTSSIEPSSTPTTRGGAELGSR